jgi:long-chain acyl-CoA synthetase
VTTDLWDGRLGVWWIAEDHPDALAVVASPSGEMTFGELTGTAHQIVRALRKRGVQPGDPVAAVLPNGVEMVAASLACQEAGWYFLPLNTYLTSAEIDRILDHSGAAALIVHQQFGAGLTDAVDQATDRGIYVLAAGTIAGVESLEDACATEPTLSPDDRRPGSVFVYTSGTTGQPKGIRRPLPAGDPSDAANEAAIFGRAFDFRPFDGPHLVSTGMYHGGSHSYYMGALNVGHGLVIMAKFDAEETLQLIEKHRVRSAYMVPTQFHRLLRLPAEIRHRYDLSSLHSVVHSAAPCPVDIKRQMMQWWGPVIWETYGGMEGPATIAKPYRWLEKPGTVGRAIKGVTLSILDDDGRPLQPGQTGRIYIENSSGFIYHGDDEGTRQAFRGRKFTLGDIGYLDDDGYLFIKDRAKDMIITGGVNVYPQEVENVLLTHPAVNDVAVIGIPDADWGEQIKAVIQPSPDVTPSSELADQLLAYCRQHLAAYKCPRSVDFRADLPRTEAGKLYKRQIRDQYWQDTGRTV